MGSLQKYQELRNKTIPGLLLERARNSPHEVAYRAKKLGIYRERTWLDFSRMVSNCAMGFKRLGLRRGQRLALMGDPCEEYVICELAAQALGAITYGIYPTSSQKDLQYLMEDGGACMFVAETEEYVDKILSLEDKLTSLRYIIIIDTTGTFMYDYPSLITYKQLMQNGEKDLCAAPQSFEEVVRQLSPSDSSFILYTSGTTGNPKGVLTSHGKHLAATYTLVDRYPILAEMSHRTVVYLPLCHILGHVVAVTLPMLTRIVPHYGEGIEDLGLTIFETAPTVFFTVPRYLKKFASRILVSIESSSPFKRLVYRMALKVGRKHLISKWAGKRDFSVSVIYFVLYQAAFRPILNKIGFDNIRLVVSGGASLPPQTMTFWQIHGLNLSEIYGQTETAGAIISAQGAKFPKPGDAGRSPAGWEVRLAENGEILVRGNDLFEGYYSSSKAKGEVIDAEGWLHTGDKGEWTSDGSLKIVDRMQDLIPTPEGPTFGPTHIENALKSSPYVSEAVVFGRNRKYISALIELDFETLSNWARLNNVRYSDLKSLVHDPNVIEFISSEIEEACREIASVQQVKAFRIIPEELNPGEDGAPVSPTRNIKRKEIYERFGELVEAMYSGKEERLV